MDSAEVWQMEDDVMLPFTDQGELHLSNGQPHYSFSSDGRFESSFQSSITSYDECYTPSSRDSFGISDLDGLSSSRTSLGSNGANSPVNDSNLYSMISMNGMAKNEAGDKAHSYVTSCQNNIQEPNMMGYEYSQVDDMYGPLELQGEFGDLTGMIFDNLSGLMLRDTASPLRMNTSSDNFVVPSQTFITEPYRPTTPTSMQRTVLRSPLEGDSQSEGTIKYFMSPRETWSQRPNSSLSSGSRSTLVRTPTSQTLETSTALQRVQSVGGRHVRKHSKRSPQVTSKIGRVEAGAFRCNHPGCKSGHGFKRHEHLKRHQRTHGAQKPVQCPFCVKSFAVDRLDNYRSHVKLHSVNKKGSRTKYFPEAMDEVLSWKKKGETDQQVGVPGEIYRVSLRRVRADSYFNSEL